MRPDIVIIGNVSDDWVAAIERDIAADLVPIGIGAIVINECQGNISLAFVDRWKWILSKIGQAIEKN